MNHPKDSRLIANPEYRQRMALSIFQGIEAYKRAFNPSGPPPSLIVSGDQPSSIPDLDPPPDSTPEATPTPMLEIKPLPDNWHLGYPPGKKTVHSNEESDAEGAGHHEDTPGTSPDEPEMEEPAFRKTTESGVRPLPRRWDIGYPPGKKPSVP